MLCCCTPLLSPSSRVKTMRRGKEDTVKDTITNWNKHLHCIWGNVKLKRISNVSSRDWSTLSSFLTSMCLQWKNSLITRATQMTTHEIDTKGIRNSEVSKNKSFILHKHMAPLVVWTRVNSGRCGNRCWWKQLDRRQMKKHTFVFYLSIDIEAFEIEWDDNQSPCSVCFVRRNPQDCSAAASSFLSHQALDLYTKLRQCIQRIPLKYFRSTI